MRTPEAIGIIKAMAIVKKLLHTRYRVDDLERTIKFYTEILDLTETRRHKSPRGSELVFWPLRTVKRKSKSVPIQAVEVCKFREDLTHLAFEVESLDDFEKHIQAHGMKYSDGPHLKEAGGGFAFIDAPEGYEIELIEKSPDSNDY